MSSFNKKLDKKRGQEIRRRTVNDNNLFVFVVEKKERIIWKGVEKNQKKKKGKRIHSFCIFFSYTNSRKVYNIL